MSVRHGGPNSGILTPGTRRNAAWAVVMLTFVIEVGLASNQPGMWYDRYLNCGRFNQTMLSWPMWEDRGRPDLNTTYPVWLYGFEVHQIPNDNGSRFFNFAHLENNMSTSSRCENGTTYEDTYTLLSFGEAKQKCTNKSTTNGSDYDFPCVTNSNLGKFPVSRDVTNTLFWIQHLNPGAFLNSEALTVHCFLLNKEGELLKDNCTKNYSSVCVDATVHDTIAYAGTVSQVPFYPPTSPTTPSTSSAGTSKFVTSPVTSETNGGVDLTTSATNNPSDLNNSTDTKSHAKEKPAMETSILILLVCVGAAVVIAIVVAVCICYRKKRRPNKDRKPTLSDGYSETTDSVNFKDAQNYEFSDVSEYATPSDAVAGGPRMAQPRSSIIEGEYDTLSNSKGNNKPKRQVAVVNAYSHVAIVPANQRRESGSNTENTYDLSTLNKQTTVTVSHQDGTGNIYGHLGVT